MLADQINMVEVFKTNVQCVDESKVIVQRLLGLFPDNKVNFDLEDCDKILRVEGAHVCTDSIIMLLNANGHKCEVLP